MPWRSSRRLYRSRRRTASENANTERRCARDWAAKHGFTLFPEKGFESVTLCCINNGAKPGGRTVDVAKLQKLVKDQGFLIDGGYGKIKGTTFRLSNMGDETAATMNQLYAALDTAIAKL